MLPVLSMAIVFCEKYVISIMKNYGTKNKLPRSNWQKYAGPCYVIGILQIISKVQGISVWSP